MHSTKIEKLAMIDTKNIETALEHLENARKMLDLQLKNSQEELSEERAELTRQQALLQEERRRFEEQKATILENLKQLHRHLQEELADEEKKEAALQAAMDSKGEVPVEELAEASFDDITEKEDVVAPKLPPQSKKETDSSFIELDEEEPAPAKSAPKKEEKKKPAESSPMLGMAVPVNDLASALQQQPLKDLVKGMGINDRFLFTKELFDGNTNTFNEVIKKLNNLGNMAEATAYLARFSDKWDLEKEVVKQFMLLVHRRYL